MFWNINTSIGKRVSNKSKSDLNFHQMPTRYSVIINYNLQDIRLVRIFSTTKPKTNSHLIATFLLKHKI